MYILVYLADMGLGGSYWGERAITLTGLCPFQGYIPLISAIVKTRHFTFDNLSLVFKMLFNKE